MFFISLPSLPHTLFTFMCVKYNHDRNWFEWCVNVKMQYTCTVWDYHLNSYETDRDVYTEDYLLQKISYSLFVDVGGLYRRLVTNVLKSRGVWHLILSNALMLSASLSVIMHDDYNHWPEVCICHHSPNICHVFSHCFLF